MTRTKALVVVGCIMLALAVMATLELTQAPQVPVEGQVVTGAISTVPPVRMNNDAPTAPLGGDVPPGMKEETLPKANGLVSLEPGTLRPEAEAMPLVQPSQGSQPSQPSQGSQPSQPLQDVQVGQADQTAQAPKRQVPAPVKAPTQELAAVPSSDSVSKLTSPSPEKSEKPVVAPEKTPVATPQAEPAPKKVPAVPPQTQAVKPAPAEPKAQAPAAKPAPEKKPAKAETPAQAEAPDKAKAPAQAEAPAKAEAPQKTTEPQAIDTAGPTKLEPGQKAIIWTRLELSDKGVVFRISGADKLEGKAFELPDPHRYVVDLQGEWAMRLPALPANSFVKKIRIGKQEANTRMVIDLDGAQNCQMVRINPTTLEFRVRN